MATGTVYANQVTNYADALNVLTFPNVKRDKITEQVVDTSPLFALMRGTSHLKEERGGAYLEERINTGLSPNASFYTGAGGWKMASFQGIIAMGWDWKLAHDGVVITGQELVINDGANEAIASLIQTRVDIASLTLPDLIASYLYKNNPYGTNSDNTTGDPAGPEGLAVLVDDGSISDTVGQRSRTTYPILKAKTNYNAGLTSSMISQWQAMWSKANRGGLNRTKVGFVTEAIYNSYWGYLQTPERYIINPHAMEALGFKSTGGSDLGFNDAVVLVDEKNPTNVPSPQGGVSGNGGFAYFLNPDFFEMVVHPDRFFSMGDWFKDPYGDQYYLDIFLAFAFKCLRPNRQAVLWHLNG